MPFGLKNAPATFQLCLEQVLRDCSEWSSNYIDDVFIFSNSWLEHLTHIESVLAALESARLTAKPSKCVWGSTHLEYLGHKIGKGTLAVPEHQVQAMLEFRRPVTQTQLRSFLGCLSYYLRFVENFADLSSKLTPATSKSAPRVICWTKEMVEAFESLRKCLCNCVILFVPSHTDEYLLHTDASGCGIGSVLKIKRPEGEVPVAFRSCQLTAAEKNYSATELELIAVVDKPGLKRKKHIQSQMSFPTQEEVGQEVVFQSREAVFQNSVQPLQFRRPQSFRLSGG